MTTIGDGHAMGWRAGAEFNMMEKIRQSRVLLCRQILPSIQRRQ